MSVVNEHEAQDLGYQAQISLAHVSVFDSMLGIIR